MKACYCDQEAAVLEAVTSGRWPQACERDLRAHVLQCSICADVALVAQTMQLESEWVRGAITPAAAGLVWWKSQIRAQREAAVRAAEPIAMVEKAAGIFSVASLLALAIWRSDWVANWIGWLAALPHSNAFHPDNAWTLALFSGLPSLSFLIISLSACLLLASLVFYLVFTEE